MHIPAKLCGTDITVNILQFITLYDETMAVVVDSEGGLRTYSLEDLRITDPIHRPGFQPSRPYIPVSTT